ncbi:hypothetical protein BpHYR1_002179 [Brachionus plicatilis]|uniref:Uncharacterized protein n=1 Tax=Brachionus plicatilis TaxID=10195 RepID=A0A3M7Q9N7_BRAPC|nr:hypothetical protein BpHYR1_002179 [Brachionus plicatilis]
MITRFRNMIKMLLRIFLIKIKTKTRDIFDFESLKNKRNDFEKKIQTLFMKKMRDIINSDSKY